MLLLFSLNEIILNWERKEKFYKIFISGLRIRILRLSYLSVLWQNVRAQVHKLKDTEIKIIRNITL